MIWQQLCICVVMTIIGLARLDYVAGIRWIHDALEEDEEMSFPEVFKENDDPSQNRVIFTDADGLIHCYEYLNDCWVLMWTGKKQLPSSSISLGNMTYFENQPGIPTPETLLMMYQRGFISPQEYMDQFHALRYREFCNTGVFPNPTGALRKSR